MFGMNMEEKVSDLYADRTRCDRYSFSRPKNPV